MSIRIIQADVMAGLAALEDQSVQCVVTSPPYWGLRDYGVEGQIGLEKTPEEYVQRMVEVFREVRRVLRDDGTVWLNIGDGYNANTGAGFNGNKRLDKKNRDTVMDRPSWLKPKDMVGIPWRLAFALQADGWYLRSDIIWSKPNPMPESVTDRPTKAHEYVFLLTKRARYFYDADAVREDHTSYGDYERRKNKLKLGNTDHQRSDLHCDKKGFRDRKEYYSPNGRNRRTVWEIATQPTPEAHFATFPEALVEPCIKAGTSERGCCSVCGAPWVRVVEKEVVNYSESPRSTGNKDRNDSEDGRTERRSITIGWQPTCTCSSDFTDNTIPCTVLDPFGGSGTVAKVARRLHRDAILIEINPAYVEIMKKCLRLNEQLFEDNRIEVIA